MGQKKKVGRERLDKYYHLAKTQGYRARSAFKLIQLNKKFNFLEKSRVLIDLCAAPGGWLQVAAKYMPMNSLIVGVDLAAIKPIPRVITHVEDITTESCRSALRKDLKEWKADVVLHDGAPNVGSAWVQDAFIQSELVLHSLRLATEFLAPKGTFVTKIFRSKNYNQLLYVFNQLFEKVEATKPPSSRNVSAEIFVVCRGYKNPKKIDPKFLDPKHVFEEVSEHEGGAGAHVMTPGNAMNTILFPEKAAKKRQREGYADGDYTLHHAISVVDFFLCPSEAKAIEILAGCHQLLWTSDEEAKKKLKVVDGLNDVETEGQEEKPSINRDELLDKIMKHTTTDEEVKICCDDLKVLGRKEYRTLLKWRKSLREEILGLMKPQKDSKAEVATVEPIEIDELAQLEALAATLDNDEKKAKKKRLKKLAKERQKLRLNMTTPTDIAIEEGDIDEIGFTQSDKKKREIAKDLAEGEMDAEFDLPSDVEEQVYLNGEHVDNIVISDDDEHRVGLELEMDEAYEEFMNKKSAKDPKLRVKQARMQEEEFTGIDAELKKESPEMEGEASTDEEKYDTDEDSIVSEPEEMDEVVHEHSSNAKVWFSNPVFNEVDLDEPEVKIVVKPQPKADKKKASKNEKKTNASDLSADEDFKKVKVKKEPENIYTHNPIDVLSTAQAITMAMEMVKDGGRHKNELMDDLGYRRNVFNDQAGLPQWFVDDESKHNRLNLPITKEAVKAMKERQKSLDARPIKKVIEAKDRKKRKSQRSLDNLKQKMNNVIEEGGEDDPELGSKLQQVSKMMKKAVGKVKASTKKEVKLVVAKGSNRALKGRPKGVKGRYKMVDSRMKKEIRAKKRTEKTKRKK